MEFRRVLFRSPELLAPAEVSVEVPHREHVVVDLDLAGGNVRGHVTYSDSTPVDDAPISVWTGGSSSEPMVAARTYDDGSYRFALEAGDHFIVADPAALDAERHVTTRRPLAVEGDGVTTFDIQLDKPNLTGSVLSPGDGVALGGVRVVLTTAAADSVPGGEVTTSGDGTFGFPLAPGASKLTSTEDR